MPETDRPPSPTDVLKHEHEAVLLVVGAMERQASGLRGGGPLHADAVAKMIDFTRNFSDGCHHNKEENVLFPHLTAANASTAAPVSVMLREHELGRAHIRTINENLAAAAAGDTSAAAAVADNLAGYAALLRAHIEKENVVLFPMADRVLGTDDQAYLAEQFERLEREETGAGVHEKYYAIAHELAALEM